MPRTSRKTGSIAKLPVLDRQNRRYLEALVPADRADELGAYEWYLYQHPYTGRMVVQTLEGTLIRYLHRLVTRSRPHLRTYFLDGNPLNCLPANLVVNPTPAPWRHLPEGYGIVPGEPRRAVIQDGIGRLPVLDRENRRYLEALVPADRAEELDAYDWRLRPHGALGLRDAQAWVDYKPVHLSRLVARPGKGQPVSFRDGDPLNCQRHNLVVEKQQGARPVPEEGDCVVCGRPLPPSTSPRKRRHCSNRCKQRQNYLRRCAREGKLGPRKTWVQVTGS